MKIVSWNCHGKFREKHKMIQSLNANIYIIQECENPEKYKNHFAIFGTTYFWCGENDNKGLGVFCCDGTILSENPWEKYCLRNFISLKVNNSFDLLCIWACSPYIEEYCIYQAINLCRYKNDMVIIGDFNSNAKWDKKHGKRNHSEVVNALEGVGLVSAYHYLSKEKQGNESKNTFYLHYDKAKGYHIDHCFLSASKLKRFTVFDTEEWLKHSDHMPIMVEI